MGGFFLMWVRFLASLEMTDARGEKISRFARNDMRQGWFVG